MHLDDSSSNVIVGCLCKGERLFVLDEEGVPLFVIPPQFSI